MRVYMAIDRDEYELPYAIADSSKELAEMVGKSQNTIESSISRLKHGAYKTSRYIVVEVDDE